MLTNVLVCINIRHVYLICEQKWNATSIMKDIIAICIINATWSRFFQWLYNLVATWISENYFTNDHCTYTLLEVHMLLYYLLSTPTLHNHSHIHSPSTPHPLSHPLTTCAPTTLTSHGYIVDPTAIEWIIRHPLPSSFQRVHGWLISDSSMTHLYAITSPRFPMSVALLYYPYVVHSTLPSPHLSPALG